MTATILAAAEVAGEASKKGLPQLDQSTFAPQLIWLAITFLALLWLMSRLIIPRIRSVIEERAGRIKRDLEEASRLKGDTEKALKAYEQALSEARGKAHGIAQDTRDSLKTDTERQRAQVDKEIGSRMASAESRIADAKAKALAQVSDIAGETAQAVVAQLLGLSVSKEEVLRAVAEVKRG